SSFSIEFLHDALIALAFLNGLDVTIYQAGFDQYTQEILGGESGLYTFAPHAVVLAVEGRRWLAPLYADPLTALPDSDQLRAEALGQVRQLVETFRSRSPAALLLHNCAPPARPALGALDGR